jgi:hypothetical protein
VDGFSATAQPDVLAVLASLQVTLADDDDTNFAPWCPER